MNARIADISDWEKITYQNGWLVDDLIAVRGSKERSINAIDNDLLQAHQKREQGIRVCWRSRGTALSLRSAYWIFPKVWKYSRKSRTVINYPSEAHSYCVSIRQNIKCVHPDLIAFFCFLATFFINSHCRMTANSEPESSMQQTVVSPSLFYSWSAIFPCWRDTLWKCMYFHVSGGIR